MNKIIKLITTIGLSFILFGCADKAPFKEQAPLDNSALVYVYAKSKVLNSDDSIHGVYQLRVNSKIIDVRLEEGQYTTINLKPSEKVSISATMGALITKNIVLNASSSGIYYLRATVMDGSTFVFEKVSTKVGLKELKETVLSGSRVEDINDAIIVQTENKQTNTKIEQIKDANQLKVDGIITQEEFNKLKTDILDVD